MSEAATATQASWQARYPEAVAARELATGVSTPPQDFLSSWGEQCRVHQPTLAEPLTRSTDESGNATSTPLTSTEARPSDQGEHHAN
jgi:hypothetical protein